MKVGHNISHCDYLISYAKLSSGKRGKQPAFSKHFDKHFDCSNEWP